MANITVKPAKSSLSVQTEKGFLKMTLSAALQGTFKEMRKDNTVGITVQTCSDIFDSNVPPAYVFWLYRLKAGETLPRGRFFRKESQSSMLWQLFMMLHSKNNCAIRKVTFMNVIAAGIFALFLPYSFRLCLL